MSPITDEELDRLADYCAGLLDPAEEAEVDRLVGTDSRWSRAHAALACAQPRVDRALAGLAEEPMPPDVAARLDRALTREASGAGTGAVVVGYGRARMWRRAALATAAVAAAFAVGVGGYRLLRGPGEPHPATSSPGGAAVAMRTGTGSAGSSPVLASGTNYTHDTLGRAPSTSLLDVPSASAPVPGQWPGSAGSQGTIAAPPSLARFNDPRQLRACLDQIKAVEGGMVIMVDLARYQSASAVVVLLGGGRVAAVAAGPSCGLPGTGPAIIDTAP